MTARFGHTELPERQVEALRRARRIEWASIAFLAVAVTAVFIVMGNSQAMKAAWLEDLLSFAPPIAFLVAARVVARQPNLRYPYGYHRAVGVSHLVAGVSLLAMGIFLIVDSATGLFTAEHPPIGSIQVLGTTVWQGWFMMGVMALTIPLPIYFGRVKMRLAEELHDKVLYADADMNRADWTTAVGSIVGVAGIGLGLWWMDAVAALFIASGILKDGIKNVRDSVTDLMDTHAMTFDNDGPHPVVGEVRRYLDGLDWVVESGCRVRDQGHVFHVEAFVVVVDPDRLTLGMLDEAREGCMALDWKIQDIVVVPVERLAAEVGGISSEHQSEAERA